LARKSLPFIIPSAEGRPQKNRILSGGLIMLVCLSLRFIKETKGCKIFVVVVASFLILDFFLMPVHNRVKYAF